MRWLNEDRRELSWVLGTVAILLASSSSTASADPRCAARLRATTGDDTSAWREAVSEVNRLIEAQPSPGSDCREMVVDADEGGADVTFTTRDERTATRRIKHPKELRALAQALLVTVPTTPTTPVAIDAPHDEEPAAPAATPPGETARRSGFPERPAVDAVSEPDRTTGPIVALGAGVTVGAGAPGGIGQLEAGYLTRGWELALVGRVEPEHDGPLSAVHTNLSASGISTLAARRAALGPVTLIFGGTFGVFYASEEGPRPTVDGAARHVDRFADPRLGAMLGCLAPRTGPLRFRGQIDAQLGLLGHTPDYADLPTFPRFTLAFSFGAETGFLP